MDKSGLKKAAVFIFAIGLVVLLYRLTLDESVQDPCAQPQSDISGAVLSDERDQDAMVNRAIIMKGRCKKKDEEE
ncbi:MAG: hypothetical protein Hals2KO_01770 [Halioglobus sp.]